MRTYAIGDVQGCYDALCRLFEAIRFDPARDRVWLVGDLVNRGPRNVEVLRLIRSLGKAATVVLGNHDLYLLMLADGFGKRQADDTLDDVLGAPDREELLAWLRSRPLLHAEGEHILVHAGLLPQWTAGQAKALASEVEAWLAGPNYRELFAHLWGSQPAAWDERLVGWDRMRVVVNAMTRMRFCTPDGTMEFSCKGEIHRAPFGHLPWFAVPGRRSEANVVVCGHWSALGLRIDANLLALDSGCLWGGHLTAVSLPGREIFQVECSENERVSCDE